LLAFAVRALSVFVRHWKANNQKEQNITVFPSYAKVKVDGRTTIWHLLASTKRLDLFQTYFAYFRIKVAPFLVHSNTRRSMFRFRDAVP
jgi:hypothetical protein